MTPAGHEVELVLLGGLRDGSRIRRDARLRTLTGTLEERLHALAGLEGSIPEKVSAIVEAAVEEVAGRPVDVKLAGELCIADRRLLMLGIARQVAGDTFWINPVCRHCGERFDVELSRSALPTKPAGATFPFADVALHGNTIRVRVPNGSDQAYIAGLDDATAMAALLRRCLTAPSSEPPDEAFVLSLIDEDIAALEDALDDVAPDVGTVMEVECPSCSTAQEVEFDPYQFGVISDDALFVEIHTLACTYHWSETEILSLSRERRGNYLRLIEQSRGLDS